MKINKLIPLFSLLSLTLLLYACDRNSETPAAGIALPGTAANAVDENQRLAAFFDEIFERNLSQSPEFQAYLGRKTEDYGRWNDRSDEYAEFENQQSAADLKRLHEEFDYAALNETSKISYRIFEYNQQRSLSNFKWRHHGYAISQMNDISSDIPTFLQNIHKIDSQKDAEDYISRLAGVETVMQQLVEQLRQGEANGVIPPMMVYPKVLPSAFNILKGAPFEEATEDGILLADFRHKLTLLELGPDETASLINDAANALSGPFRSGYQLLITELQRLQSIADNNHGVWNLPDGEAFYANRIQNWTTVARTPEDIHELGLAEVSRIRTEMQQIMNELGYAGDLASFFEYVRNSPENYYENTDAGRAEYIPH